ncbi:MAG: putative acetyl-CoA hydrolase/transferase [Pseudonocardiales bacterium]|nr:putative acetyl-CoA hydrolase/transferase [Pseudonocardiales bacterium]
MVGGDEFSAQSGSDDAGWAAAISRRVPPGGLIAFGDGAGLPLELWPAVVDLLNERADIRLFLGWWFTAPERVDALTPDRVRTIVSGFGMRRAIDNGQVGFIPARLGAVPGLLGSSIRPDVLVAALRPVGTGLAFTTEVSWQRSAIAAGAAVVAIVRPESPGCDVQPTLAQGSVTVVGESAARPVPLAVATPNDTHWSIAAHVASLVGDGARVQVGPGGLGAAIYGSIKVAVAVDTGLITDPVIDLDRRGLLLDAPIAPYVAGSDELYDWADGRVQASDVAFTHNPARLIAGRPLVAVNSALEIDLDGQVNAELAGGSWAGGIGGQPDYAAAAATSPNGISIFCLASTNGGRPTLVERLAGPVTTPGHDVEIVVTEKGTADLRGLTRPERRRALTRLWEV